MRNIPALIGVLFASLLADLAPWGLVRLKESVAYEFQDMITLVQPHPWQPALFGLLFSVACLLTISGRSTGASDIVKATLGLPIFFFVSFQGLAVLASAVPAVGGLPLLHIAHGLYAAAVWLVACEVMDKTLGGVSLVLCLALGVIVPVLPEMIPAAAPAGMFYYTSLGLVLGICSPR